MSQSPDGLRELQNHHTQGERILALHYACENLYQATDHPAAVSCIGYCPVGSGNAGSFSLNDAPGEPDSTEKEVWLLSQYFEFLRRNSNAVLAHWNMSKADYGFAALEARYRHLTGSDVPYHVPEDRTFDLDDLVAQQYGAHYVDHPRLIKLALLNGLRRQAALAGPDEAATFDAGDHAAVRRSTDEKVHWIAALTESLLSGRLVTDRSVGSISFVGRDLDAVQTVVELAERMRYVERELLHRHAGRPTIVIENEYDAQDLFRSLLRVFFDDIRPEDFVPSYAGASSRIDFVLPEAALAVELKHSRESMTARSLGEELIVDVERYSARRDVRHLICVVFDYNGRLANPRGLEGDLSRESTQEGTGVTVVILDR